ncbi:hypothetical protein HNP46_000983 [Pseudomonas nitritireducens]|uniref:Chalcone isomerase domain-containing protein n=1 Tax=Pseudomonas nitroreducens TaxID=46680 RepID=A0A7W7P0A4_PSENT|nr:chalcone isomerase family protein [Pseudomonas nitritireducens]MBB4862145.1 hypothetical protein [Pseudomonas nitritireducens]
MRAFTTSTALCWSIALLCSLWASTSQADWRSELPGAVMIGQGRFTWFGLTVYEARLWSAGRPVEWQQPFALELIYRRALSRDTLVQASVDEMRRLGNHDEPLLADWAGEMRQAFVDVREGQRITGLYHPDQGCRFYVDGQFRHEVTDARFARAFFAIWLDPRTRKPELRRELLGLNGDQP